VSRSGDTRSAADYRRPAVFLDRDGTIIDDVGYLRDPSQIRLLPGAAEAIRRLNASGLLTLVVTNQSGIARGLLSEADYHRVEQRLDALLNEAGAHLDGHYFCPHLPDVSGPCECRKPGTLLYRQAADRMGIDLRRSWWVGDRARDVLPAAAFGARGVLVLGELAEPEASVRAAHRVLQAPDLAGAVDLILKALRVESPS
jgi:D-glycero-D-manno-heptose 1,7-bisphosphate phosphatase